MEKLDKNKVINKNNTKFILFDNLNRLDNCEYLIILDFYHLNIDNEVEYIEKHLNSIKEVCYLDDNISYLIFIKPYILEEVEGNQKIRSYLNEMLNQNKNIFYEQKSANIHFLSGFVIAKGITIYIFTDENSKNSNWLKLSDSTYDSKIKFSEFEFLKVTMEYMLREKKRNYDKNYGKQPSKLSMLLSNNQNPSYNTKIISTTNNINVNNKLEMNHNEILNLHKFQQIVNNIIQYFTKSPPNSFKIIKNIITNFSEHNSNFFFKNYNIREDVLSFLLFSELINRDVIINQILKNLIRDKIITNTEEIDTLLCFFINPDIENVDEDDYDGNPRIEGVRLESKDLINKKSKRKKKDASTTNFSISDKAESEYKNLILNCPPICNYVGSLISKILSNFGISSLDRLPTNPGKYKNYILSFVNNQELLKISKKILNLDYEKIINILTEGIIIEFLKNNLVIFLSEKKIHYNIPEIEKEKFRLSQQLI